MDRRIDGRTNDEVDDAGQPAPADPAHGGARHECMIYEGAPSRMLPDLAVAIRSNLEARKRCVYLDSPAMVAGLRSQLHAVGVDPHRELARGALVLSDDGDHLVDGHFVIDRMIERLELAVEGARALVDAVDALLAAPSERMT